MTLPLGVEELEEIPFEELDQRVAAALLEDLRGVADKISRVLNELREVLRGPEIDELQRLIRKIESRSRRVLGAAVDSTFPPEGGIELVGGLLVGIVAGYVLFGYAQSRPSVDPRALYGRMLLLSSESAKQYVPYAAKLLEKKVVLRLLDYCEKKLLDLKLIVLDGELIPYRLLFSGSRSIERRRILKALDDATVAVLEKSKRLGITLVGVVKRSYSRLLSSVVGRRLALPDKAVFSLLLRPGEYMVLGDYSSLLPKYAEAIKSSELKRVVVERLERRPEYGRVAVCFYKPSKVPAHAPAVKVEVLDYGGLGLSDLMGVLNSLTNPATGLPYPIDLIDSLTRLETKALEVLRRKLVYELASYIGPLASTLLSHSNPEKRYLHEPGPLRSGTRGPLPL